MFDVHPFLSRLDWPLFRQGGARVKLQRNGFDFIFLDPDGMGRKDSIGQARFTGLT